MSNKTQFENSIQQTLCPKIQVMNSIQQKKSYDNLYLNPLELELRGQSVDYALKFIDVYPVYCLKGQKYICYRKILKSEQQYSMIQEHINSSTYEWKENVYHNTISLYYFMNVSKGQECFISSPYAFHKDTENDYFRWKIWGVLEDGTILSPSETRKIIKLLQGTTVESYFNIDDDEEERNAEKAREYYATHFAEGDSDVW